MEEEARKLLSDSVRARCNLYLAMQVRSMHVIWHTLNNCIQIAKI